MENNYDLDEVLEDLDENFNFNKSLNKLIDREVDVRLKEKINHYNVAISERKELFEKNSSLQVEVINLQNQLDNAETKFKEEGSDDAKREMLGGFKLDDKVWFIKKDRTYTECQDCEKGYLTLNYKGQEVKAQCPKCRYGRICNDKKYVTDGQIKEIKIHTWYHGKKLETTLYVDPLSIRSTESLQFNVGQLFGTKEEAEYKLQEMDESQ